MPVPNPVKGGWNRWIHSLPPCWGKAKMGVRPTDRADTLDEGEAHGVMATPNGLVPTVTVAVPVIEDVGAHDGS